MEIIMKGVANHWRVKILFLIYRQPRITLDQIAQNLEANFVTISIHVSKMVHAGLIKKNYKGRFVQHILTKRGESILTFLKMLK